MKSKCVVSIILSTFILISSLFVFPSTAQAKNKYLPYKKIVSSAINKNKKIDDSSPYITDFCAKESAGFLYDFDKNGIKELVLTNFTTDKNNIRWRVLSVYTIIRDKTVPLIKNKKINSEAGDPIIRIGVATKKGKSYLVVNYCIYQHGYYGIIKRGNYKYFAITKNKVTLKYKTKFTLNYDGYESNKIANESYKLNNKKVSHSKYNSFKKSFSYKNNLMAKTFNVNLNSPTTNKNTLNKLLKQVS